MDVTLAFIFRGEGSREHIFKQVKPIVSKLYNFDKIGVYDSLHDIFSRSGSRNLAISENISSDVVVVCDADSIPIQDSLIQAIEGAYADRKLHIPFNFVKVLPYTRFLRDPERYEKCKVHYTYGPSCGGIYVVSPQTWIAIGGMDERVIGWGHEDQIFLAATNTFTGGPVFHEGTLYNINHHRDTSSTAIPENRELVDRYLAVQWKPEEFRLVQSGSNSFHPNSWPSGPDG